MKTKILLVAQPFAFGPVGSLMSLRRQVEREDLEWRYLGPTYTRQVVDDGLFSRVDFLGDGDLASGEALRRAISDADVVVSGTEFHNLETAVAAGRRLVIYDPLFWFWPTVPPIDLGGMTYICQNFPGVEERVASLPGNLAGSFVVTPPVRQHSPAVRDPNPHLVVNLCGLINPIQTLVGYDEIVGRCLEEALQGTRWRKVTITGCLDAMPGLRSFLKPPLFELRRLSHPEMMDCIRSAWLFLTCPGLNSAMEGISLGIPTAFLPPQNASQARQAEIFQNNDAADGDANWCTLAGEGAIWKSDDQAASIATLGKAMNNFRDNTWQHRELVACLRRAVTMDEWALQDLAGRQERFFQLLAPPHLPAFSEVFDGVIDQISSGSPGPAREVRLPVMANGGPELLQVEITTLCNLRCVFCHNDDPRVQERGSMSFETFASLLVQVKTTCRRVNLWGTGEPFLHPDLFRMASLARDSGVPRIKVSTNGHFLTPNNVDRILQSGITDVRISLESACPDQYERERRGGSLGKVVEGVKLLVQRRNQQGSALRVVMASVVSTTEKNAAADVAGLVRGLGADEHEIIPNIWADQLPGLRLDVPNRRCSQPETTLHVQANGDVIPCCKVYLGSEILGNVMEHPVESIWSGSQAATTRNRFRAGTLASCANCNYGASLETFGSGEPRVRSS